MLLLLFLLELTTRMETGYATIYWPKDGYCGSHRADGRPFKATDSHIAHRTLPLGTTGHLCNVRTRRCIATSVQDRGPFGALLSCKSQPLPFPESLGPPKKIKWKRRCYWWQAQVRLQPGWTYRGSFDITKPVATAIRHRAFDKVVFVYSRKSRKVALLED